MSVFLPDLSKSELLRGVALDQTSSIGRDDKLANSLTGVADADYIDPVNSIFAASASVKCKPYWCEWFDIEAKNVPAFGRESIFHFGHEGNTLQTSAEIHVQLTIENTGAADFETVPFVMERLGGDVTLTYANSQLRRYTADFLHARNRVTSDVTTEQDSAYQQHVLADPVQIPAGETVTISGWVPVWLPWNVQEQNAWCQAAAPDEMRLKVAIPEIDRLVRIADPTAVGPALTDLNVSLDSFRLRSHSVILQRSERAAKVMATQRPSGIAWQAPDNEVQEAIIVRPNQSGTLTDIRTFRQRLDNIINPVIYLKATQRFQADVDGYRPGQVSASPDDQAVNPHPDWTRYVPFIDWCVTDGGQQITPKYTPRYYELNIRPKIFKSAEFLNIAVVPHSKHPLEEGHSLGHSTYNNYRNPEFLAHYQERFVDPNYGAGGFVDRWTEADADPTAVTPTAGAAILTKRFDIYATVRNIVHFESGYIQYFYR